MTAYVPPPTVLVQDGELSIAGRLTQDVATRHVAQIQTTLTSLEEAIADLPPGQARERLQYRVLRLHNQLGRGGQALNDHFQTAQVSPDSAGGDKDPPSQPQQQQLVQDA
jgi:hypothetical protein